MASSKEVKETVKGESKEVSAFDRKDFLWRNDRNQWHVQRSIEMRKKYKEKISDLEGYDPWTLLDFSIMSGSHWLLAYFFASYFE